MFATRKVAQAVVLVGLATGTTGCGLLERFTGDQPDEQRGADPAGEGEEPAAADDSKAEAPGRFGDQLFLPGKTAELAGLNATVAEVKECRYERDASQKSLERSGRKLVGARMVFEGTGEQPVRVSRRFRAHDSDRVVFRLVSLGGTDCTPQLANGRLRTEEKAKGWVGFRVPKQVQGLTMRYEHRPPKQSGAKGTPDKQYPEFSLSS